jgi:hypothetical protein
MPQVESRARPDEARVWVFAASDVLSAASQTVLLARVDAFLAQWRAHGAPLDSAREFRDGRFLCVSVDQRPASASGCSIDGLFRELRALEAALGTTMVASGLVFWRDADGVVQRGTREQFAAHAAAGQLTANTRVFDTTVATLGDWRHAFERPAAESWHARYLLPTRTG